jgi:hypothetical protein
MKTLTLNHWTRALQPQTVIFRLKTNLVLPILTLLVTLLGIATAGAQINVGNTATSTGSDAGNYITVDQYATTVPLNVTQIKTYGTSSGTLSVTLYSDDGNNYPGTKLFTEVSASVTANTWSTITVPTTYLPPGNYWIAFNLSSSSSSANYITKSTGVTGSVRKFQVLTYGTTFPTTLTEGSWSPGAAGTEDSTYFVGTEVTTTTVSSSANPSVYGQSGVTFTGTVKTNGVTAGTATGTVQFQTNGVNFGSAVALSGGSATSSALPTTLPAGSYNVTAVYSGDSNFATSTSGTFSQTVNARALTITANAQNKVYGTTQTTPVSGSSAFTPTGLQNGETVGTVTLTYGAGGLLATSTAGSTSTITPSAATGGTFTAGNYTITYTAGTLTVTTAPLTITATGPSKTYGTALTTGTSSANFTASATQNGETVTSVTLTPNAAGLSATTAAGAAYTVTPSAATGGGGFLAANYNITYVVFNGTVAKGTPTISGVTGSQSISYGTASVTLSGIVSAGSGYPANGETVSVTINGSTQNAATSGGAGGFSVSFPTATIPPSPTAYTITYAYAGDANLNAAANNTGTALTVTGISVPNLSYTPATGTGLRILLSDITGNAGTKSSQSSPAYAITGVSASSTQSGTVANNSTTILYTPPNNTITSDTFTYTLTDGTASATATVTVNFVSPTGPTLSITLNGSNNPVITFYGILGQGYHIQRSPDMVTWADVQAVTIASTGDGSYTWTDTGATGSANYYRLRYP